MILGAAYESPSLEQYGLAAIKVLIFVGFLILLWVAYDKITHCDDENELFVKKNVGYAILRVGIVLAQAIALLPLISTTTGDFGYDIRPLIGWGFGVTAFLIGLNWVLNKIIRHRGTLRELNFSSQGDSVLKAGLFITTGIIFNAALSGTAPDFWTAFWGTLTFGGLGLLAVAIGFIALGFIGPFKKRMDLKDDNLASSLISSGAFIGLGLILRGAIAGDFVGWVPGLAGFAITFVLGLVVMVAMMFAVDRFIITSSTLTQIVANNHTVAAGVMAVMLISVAMGVSAVAV